MQSHGGDVVSKVESRSSRSPPDSNRTSKRSFDVASVVDDGDDPSFESASNQLVLYNPDANSESQDDHNSFRSPVAPSLSGRVLPSVGAFTVQCASCFKWRLIPTKAKYEEIRETILQEPFTCERAREWRPDVTCEDPADISQDGSRLWAIDKPNIAQPPRGWERLLRIRGEGSTKFADIYYVSPSGKRMRSMKEVERYLSEHPDYARQGVTASQFSFMIPRPLQENYVRKRPKVMSPDDGSSLGPLQENYVRKRPKLTTPDDGSSLGLSRPLEPAEVNPISCKPPTTSKDLQVGSPGLSTPSDDLPDDQLLTELRPKKKKRASKPSSKQTNSSPDPSHPKIKIKVPPQDKKPSSEEKFEPL